MSDNQSSALRDIGIQNARCSRCNEILTGKHAEGCPYPAELAEAMRPMRTFDANTLQVQAALNAAYTNYLDVWDYPCQKCGAVGLHLCTPPRPSFWQRIARWFRVAS